MKEIEEKAFALFPVYDKFGIDWNEPLRNAYIQGAAEQEEITKKELIDKACLLYEKHAVKKEILTEDFRKLLEE